MILFTLLPYEMITITIGIAALVLSLIKLNSYQKENRIKYIQDVYGKYLDDNEMIQFFNIIEWEDSKNFDITNYKIVAERFLGHMNFVCYLLEQKMIDEHHITIFSYMLKRLLKHEAINKYLLSIKEFSERNKTPNPYQALFNHSLKMNLI
jgi:hypothetical protein